MNDTTSLALLIFGILGWALSLYFGFFRFKQFVWSRNKVSYDLFTRQNQRRQYLSNRLLRLYALGKQGKGIAAKRDAALVTYLEHLRESWLLVEKEVVSEEQVKHWLESIINQLEAFGGPLAEQLSAKNSTLRFGFPHLDVLLSAAASPNPNPDHLYRQLHGSR